MAIPVTLEDAKRQLRVELDDAERDTEIADFIADAAAWVEQYTGHILVARDVTEQVEGFRRVRLKAWPISPTTTFAVAYDIGAGPVVVPGARMRRLSRPLDLLPAFGSLWPIAANGTRVTVTFRAGYEPGDPVPGNLRRAMLVLISGYDVDREGGDAFQLAEKTARTLCSTFRARDL